MLRARKKRCVGTAPRPIAQFPAKRRCRPSVLTSISPPAPSQRGGEHSLLPGVAVNVARNSRPEMSIARSGSPHCCPQQRSLFPSAKCNPGQRDRRAALSEFSGPPQLPPVQAKGETIGHIRFLPTLARKNNRFPRRALSRTTDTLRVPFRLAPRKNAILRPLVSQLPRCSRVSPSPAPASEVDPS